jgi:putative IMPACT (imprinted ancient) family translation regulator
MLEDLMRKHAEEIKKIQRLSNQQILADKEQADAFTDRLKRQHLDVEHHMKERHAQLENDKKLMNGHIEQLSAEADQYRMQLERMEQRLER